MRKQKPVVIQSDAVKSIVEAIRRDQGEAEAERYQRCLLADHHHEARKAWRVTPEEERRAMFVVVHEREVGGYPSPLSSAPSSSPTSTIRRGRSARFTCCITSKPPRFLSLR